MKAIAGLVGAILLGASIFLAFVSNKHEITLKNNKILVAKYCEKAKESLENDDLKSALKYAKMAIAVDPKNKDGFKVLEEIYQYKYKPSDNDEEEDSSSNSTPNEEEEEEEDMGC